MTGIQAAKTVFIGLAIMLGLLTAAGAWGVFRKVVTSVPVEGGWWFLAVAIAAFASIPVACKVLKESE